MKLIVILAVMLSACATKNAAPPSLSLEQLRTLQLDQRDCRVIERRVEQLELNQKNAGVARIAPELLEEPDREYQARTRIAIWALRIGCSNPDRYAH